MKKILLVIICLSLLLSTSPFAAAATEIAVVVTAGGTGYNEVGSWYNSGLKGYMDGVTRYAAAIPAEATWTPNIIIPGTYEVFFYKVIHTSNDATGTLEVNSKDGKNVMDINTIDGVSGFQSIGQYNFDAGTGGYVKMIKKASGKMMRTSAVRFVLIKGDPNANVVPVQDPVYPDIANRNIGRKEVSIPDSKAGALNIYVKPGANGDGTMEESPLGSLAAAQAKVRDIINSGYPENGVTVNMMGGIYSLDNTLNFNNSDSGTKNSPVIWKAYMNEKVVVTTGNQLQYMDFEAITDSETLARLTDEAKDKVKVIDLKKAGINSIEKTDFINKAPYSLVVGDEAQTTAKWPNQGYANTGTLVNSASRMDSGPRKKGFTYSLNEPRALRWETATDAWLNGFWLLQYSMNYIRLADLDTNKMTMSGKDPVVWGSASNARYYICNLLEEIDEPSEFFLDTDALKLYYFPIEGWQNKDIILSASNSTILKFENCSNVVFRDAILEDAGSDGVIMGNDSSNNLIAGVTIRNVSGKGAIINGKDNGIRDCDIYSTGGDGVFVGSGDVKRLIPANNYIENCSIHDIGNTSTDKRGIAFEGVGNRMSNNHIYNIPQQGIIRSNVFSECIIENNMIERTNYDFDDTGAIYINFPGNGYGTKIRNNLITDCVGITQGEFGAGGAVHGIYIDNGTYGIEITDNIVINANNGIMSNYGRDLVIKDNILINTMVPINISTWWNPNDKQVMPGGEIDVNINNYTTPEFLEKYPEAHNKNAMMEDPSQPKYDVVENNFAIGTGIKINPQAVRGGSDINNVKVEAPAMLFDSNVISDYNAIRENLGKSAGKTVGIYTGGLRANTTAPIITNRSEEFKLITPCNKAANVDPANIFFLWESKKGGMTGNTIFFAEDAEFKNLVAMDSTENDHIMMNLDYGKTYYWRVQVTPKYNYEKRWNSGGASSFTTISMEDKLENLIIAANSMVANVQRSSDTKQVLETVITIANDALKIGTKEQKLAAIESLQEQSSKYMAAVSVDKEDLSTYVYDDFTLDTAGERPLGLFLRSYQPLNVNAVDLNGNMAVKFDDQQDTTHYGNIVFQNQTAYVEASTDVMAESTNASFSVTLKETDKDPVVTGVSNNSAAKVIFANDGFIYGDKGKTKKLMQYEANKWYKVKIALDFTMNTYEIYINGALAAKDLPITDNVKSTYQILFDTSDGTANGAKDKGIFYIDNVIVKAPSNKGRNSFLNDISVSGKKIDGFDADKFVYNIDMSGGELAAADIGYSAGENAHVYIYSNAERTKRFIVVYSGDFERYNVYTLKGK